MREILQILKGEKARASFRSREPGQNDSIVVSDTQTCIPHTWVRASNACTGTAKFVSFRWG